MNTRKPNKKPGVNDKVVPLRICHLADVHLGYRRYNRLTKNGINQREMDVNLAFHEAVSRIIALKPSVTIIAGDLFHSVRPSNTVVTFCFRELRRLAQGTKAPIILVAGNHESPKRLDTGSLLRLFSEIDGIFVAEAEAKQFRFDDLSLNISCLPHPALSDLEALQVRAEDSCTYNVLVVHAQVNEKWVSDFGGVDIALEKLNPHEWDYIALGHVHLYKQVSMNACYSGALEHTASNIWAEGDNQKGFIEIELPSSKRIFHALTAPREVLALPALDAAEMEPQAVEAAIKERIESARGGLAGKIVRLEVSNLSREVYRLLNHKELKQLRADALNFTLDIRSPEHYNHTRAFSQGSRGKLSEELKKFCENNVGNVADAKELSELLSVYLERVEAADEAS